MNERARQRAHTVHNMETKLLGVVLQGMPVEHMAPILPRHMRGSTTSGQRQLDIAAISSMAALTGNTREQPAAPGKKDRLDKATAPTKQGPLALCGGPLKKGSQRRPLRPAAHPSERSATAIWVAG